MVGATRSNGVSSSYTYDSVGRVLSIVHSRGMAVLNSQTYTYDAVGNRASYSTNNAQPLITQPFEAKYDNENRLLTRGSITYTYDENGNRVSESGPGGATTYIWDSRNRLQAMTLPGGQRVTFRYDFAGNMIEKQTAGAGVSSAERYVLDNLTNVGFQSDSAGQQMSILTGRSIDSHFAVIRSGGRVDFGLEDSINSAVATANEVGLQNVQFFYEPYGETTRSGGDFPFQFTGRVPVQGGIYYYRARFYDPANGRFISEDPIGFSGGDINLYSYVANNPINYVDPSGRFLNPAIIRIIAILLLLAQLGEIIEFCHLPSEPIEFLPPEDEIGSPSERHPEIPKRQPHTHEEEPPVLPVDPLRVPQGRLKPPNKLPPELIPLWRQRGRGRRK